ncbi:MAG: helix-turn-helix domain-containing protein [Aquabacterium sp.]
MTEAAAGPDKATAGSLLKAARQAQNMHIGVLAANLKVPQARLDALEADRYDEMPDSTFVRALALSVCRVLKVDAQPILALLPTAGAHGLERVDGGLNAPFRERPGRIDPIDAGVWRQPLVWVVALLLAGALAFVAWPKLPLGLGGLGGQTGVSSTVSSPVLPVPGGGSGGAAAMSSTAAQPAVATPAVSAGPTVAPATPSAAGAAGGPVAEMLAVGTTWVEVTDADGRVVLSRHLQQGESANAQGRLPLRVVIGNAHGTRLQFAGRPVDLGPATRDNVARLELNLP